MNRVPADRIRAVAKNGHVIARFWNTKAMVSGQVECREAQDLARDLADLQVAASELQLERNRLRIQVKRMDEEIAQLRLAQTGGVGR